jgi:hypothetical protein
VFSTTAGPVEVRSRPLVPPSRVQFWTCAGKAARWLIAAFVAPPRTLFLNHALPLPPKAVRSAAFRPPRRKQPSNSAALPSEW